VDGRADHRDEATRAPAVVLPFLRALAAREPDEGPEAAKVPPKPTLPFTDEEMAAILEAIDRYPQKDSFGYDNRARFRAFVLLLRYAGLRITDATAFDFSKLDDNRVFLYQVAGVHSDPAVGRGSAGGAEAAGRDAVLERPRRVKSAVSHWQRALGNLFKLAGVQKGYAQRFRERSASRCSRSRCRSRPSRSCSAIRRSR
jgi:integrase